MGSCCGTKAPKSNNRFQETKFLFSDLHTVDMDLYNVLPSVCKIRVNEWVGSGFFIKLKEINYLMTNEHVITRKAIDNKNNILIYYNCEKENLIINLNKCQRHIQEFRNINLDITIVEILPKDRVDDYLFLEPEINEPLYLRNKKIYIPQFPGGKKLSHSEGTIDSINGYEFSYTASTMKGSSGSPILLKNSIKVIGIHKEGDKFKLSRNYGNLIYK